MSRSTFSILPYINRQKVKADGTANILCRINISLHTLGHFLAYLSKVAQELRLEALCHSECISINQNLSVAAVTCTDSDCYSLYLLA